MSTTPHDNEASLREALVQQVHALDAQGLNRGSTGNASARLADGFLVTPTGVGGEVQPADLAIVRADGRHEGRWQPSSEWPFHDAIYRARPDVNAVVHTHSVHAAALSCLRRELPPFHYMIALAGGDRVCCAPYALFGTHELSRAVVQALGPRHACLLANHGLVAAGRDLAHAAKVAVEIEALCEMYLKLLATGSEPALLDAAQMAAVIERFRSYGQRAQ